MTKELLQDYDVILASASPRRRELMEIITKAFRVIPADCEEIVPENISAEDTAEYLSKLKCRHIGDKFGESLDSLVIGCDTVVVCGCEVLGKPADKSDAERMLRLLSGKAHKVITGVTLGMGGKFESFSCETTVYFRTLSDEEINWYISTGEPFDKAGAYGIQGFGSLLVEKICGDFFNVVGMPVSMLNVKLREFLN